MAILFPASLDALTNPTSSDNLNTGGVVHSVQHSNLNDAVEALQAKVGIDDSGNADSLDYKVRRATSYSAENKDVGTVSAGMACAVHSSGTGITKASAADATKPAIGLMRSSTLTTVAGDVQMSGLLTLADWTAVIGGAALSAHALYFLDPATPGKLTVTPPTTVGQVAQVVGRAVSTDTMEIAVGHPILL